jgi:hypothetical protein
MRSILFSLAAVLAVVVLATPAVAAETSNTASYPLTTCIVSGETLGSMGDPVTKTYGDREVRFCCENCVPDFEKDQAAFLQKLDAAIVEAQLESYPLETCVVSGEALGSMGDPVNLVVGNRLVRLCCSNCTDDVTADPATFVAKLDAAVVAAQVADYPASTCPISGQKLGSMGDPYDYVFAGQLVRFCCGGCIGAFDENPAAAMASVYGGKAAEADADADADADSHAGHGH